MALFIFEIGTEEMPARFANGLTSELGELLAKGLADARIDHGELSVMSTPRRLVAQIADMAETQRREEQEVLGPPARAAFDAAGHPTKAALGFAKGQGVEPADLYVKETEKGAYVAARKTVGGGRTLEALQAICAQAVQGLSFPKKMRWGSGDFAFGRPIRWLLALLGADVIDFELAGMRSGRNTWGHRVMGPGPFSVTHAEAFRQLLREEGRVVLNPQRRLHIVKTLGEASAGEVSGEVIWKDDLLAEVINLVEHPIPLLGNFDPAYLELPREVLLTSMQSHQKSFGVQDGAGRLMPHFLTVINLEPTDETLVRKGWERVLKARLEDARFFWRTDLSNDFDAWLNELDNVIFIGPLGSMGDKSRRLSALCGWLAQALTPEITLAMAEAGRLAKADLVSGMVGEFDTLQGIMGGIYARKKGKDETVARAISQQYLPSGPDSPTPDTLEGSLLSMADKADTLAGCFGLDMIPTGAADPYALRRAALGIIRIVLDLGKNRGLRLSLNSLLGSAISGYKTVTWKLPPQDNLARLVDFIGQRLKALYTARGYETLVVEAALGAGFDDLADFDQRVAALATFSRSDGFGQAVLTFKRAANIIRKQGAEAGTVLTGLYDPARLENDHERALAAAIEAAAPRFDSLRVAGDYGAMLGLLAELRPAVDAFFDNTMVICDDPALRANRLNLLASLTSLLGTLADFNALQV